MVIVNQKFNFKHNFKPKKRYHRLFRTNQMLEYTFRSKITEKIFLSFGIKGFWYTNSICDKKS